MDITDLLDSCSTLLSKSLSQESSSRSSLFEPLISLAISKAIANRNTKPESIIFVFHCPLPDDCTKISYRDISGDQSRSDYEDMIGFHANLACYSNPESLWLLITDGQFNPNIHNYEALQSRGQIAIARLPLNPYQLMFERVLSMYAYRLGEGINYNTSFVDGDAFIIQSLQYIWRATHSIFLTYRRVTGLMPVNEGVFHVRAGATGLDFSRNHLTQYEYLETMDIVRDYYGSDIRRWRGGQLALNSLARIMINSISPSSEEYPLCMLPCFYFNATPSQGIPFNVSEKCLVHLKGNMKDNLNQLKQTFSHILDMK